MYVLYVSMVVCLLACMYVSMCVCVFVGMFVCMFVCSYAVSVRMLPVRVFIEQCCSSCSSGLL
jgi:hypothetical protein